MSIDDGINRLNKAVAGWGIRRVSDLADVLRLIADGRGQCETCGADCEGSGLGVTPDPCPKGDGARRRCIWAPGDHVERAKRALEALKVSAS